MRRLAVAGMVLLSCIVGSLALDVATGWTDIFRTPAPPKRPITEMVLDSTTFPTQAVDGELMSPLPRASWSSAGRSIYLGNGVANHDMYHYRTARRAAREFQTRKELQFFSGTDGPWAVPDDLTYRSPLADQYFVVCGVQLEIYMCKMIAQYDEYYVLFNAHIEDEMTLREVPPVLQAIDERMARCLDR